MNNIIVCGGDERNRRLCIELIKKGYRVKWIYAEKFPSNDDFIDTEGEKFPEGDVIILPLPLSRDSKTLNAPFSDKKIALSAVIEEAEKYPVTLTSDDKIPGINYFADEAVTVDNARLTAVGFLKELLIFEKEDIMGKNALVTGFGRVSRAVCDILYSNRVNVTVAARSEAQRHIAAARGYKALSFYEAEKSVGAYDYIINTVPAKVFSADFIEACAENTAFFELASGLYDKSKARLKAYIECKGMPGKHTPDSAGKVIADFVSRALKE